MAPWQRKWVMLLFGLGISLVLWGSGADLAIQVWLNTHYNQYFNDLTRGLGWLGLGRNQVTLCLIVGFWMLLRCRGSAAKVRDSATNLSLKRRLLSQFRALPQTVRVWFACLPVFLSAGGLAIVLKLLVGRGRPKEVMWNGTPYGELRPGWLSGQFDSGFMSWPSGHSASTFAIGTLLCLAYPRWRAPIVAAMVGLSAARFLALTPHYLGDVVAGAALGAVVALTLAPWLGIKPARK